MFASFLHLDTRVLKSGLCSGLTQGGSREPWKANCRQASVPLTHRTDICGLTALHLRGWFPFCNRSMPGSHGAQNLVLVAGRGNNTHSERATIRLGVAQRHRSHGIFCCSSDCWYSAVRGTQDDVQSVCGHCFINALDTGGVVQDLDTLLVLNALAFINSVF